MWQPDRLSLLGPRSPRTRECCKTALPCIATSSQELHAKGMLLSTLSEPCCAWPGRCRVVMASSLRTPAAACTPGRARTSQPTCATPMPQAAFQRGTGVFDEPMSSFFRNVDARRSPAAEIGLGDGTRPISSLRARAVLVDMEEGVVSQVMRSPLAELFDR